MKKVSALLLAAGHGTRLKPLTMNWPKCLMPIGKYPLLEYWLSNLYTNKIFDVYVNLHSHNEIVEQFLQRDRFSSWVKPIFEKELLGTAGTLLNLKEKFKNNTVLLIHADNWSVFNLNDFLNFHFNQRPDNCPITMMTFETNKPEQSGIVETNSKGIVTRFHEKIKDPPGNIANAAVYLIELKEIDQILKMKKITDFSTQIIPKLIGRIATWKNNNIHKDIGTKDILKTAQNDLKPNIYWHEKDNWYINFTKNPIHKLVKSV